MRKYIPLLLLSLLSMTPLLAESWETLPTDTYFTEFKAVAAPAPRGLLLRPGDRLAICGDSITEQRKYSRLMETYLTVCVPELRISVRQYGWSGEKAPGFLKRMKNDVLRFDPSIATTCYGMNDHRYQPYVPEYGQTYEENSRAIIHQFKEQGVRLVQGSAGTVGKMPSWVKEAKGTVHDLNLSLLQLRNIDVRLARSEGVGFADIFVPMLVQGFFAKQTYGDEYMITGKDGVHPDWAGQVVMAYAFLTALGLDGDIGTLRWDLARGRATASEGHRIVSSDKHMLQIESRRYPFCASGPLDQDSSIRSGMTLVPFNQHLNRFILKADNAKAKYYQVTWGETTRRYSAAELTNGINLADDFHVNPFSEAFNKVDEAVAKKQEYETRQIKTLFHGPEGRTDMETTVSLTEKVRTTLAEAIASAFVPVQHTIRIAPSE
jgi:hypothetical protein